MRNCIVKVESPRAPLGYFAAYDAHELDPVQRRFTYHPERHNGMLYDLVADDFKNGSFLPYPYGSEDPSYPAGIVFTFEKIDFIVLLPDPRKEFKVLICPKDEVEDVFIERAARVFAQIFVIEYKRLYSNAIKHSKKKNGV